MITEEMLGRARIICEQHGKDPDQVIMNPYTDIVQADPGVLRPRFRWVAEHLEYEDKLAKAAKAVETAA